MASLKTSQETSGYPLQKNDLHRIARSGNNHKVNSEELFSEVLTYSQFETKRGAGNLIAGRWYKVTQCGYDLNQDVLVLADTNGSFNHRIKWLSAPNNTVECDAILLNQDFIRYYDNQGNDYGGYGNFCAEFPPLGGGNWYNTKIDNISNCCFTNANSGVVSNSYLNNVTLDFQNITIQDSSIINLADGGIQSQVPFVINDCDIDDLYFENNKSDGQIAMNLCKLHNVEIYFSGVGQVVLTELNLKDCILYITEDATIQNSSFNNATIELFGGQLSVDNLQVFGKGFAHTYYKIDGTLQSQVLNSWAGIVVADNNDEQTTNRTGYSTVKMKLNVTTDFSGAEGTYDIPSVSVYLPTNSVVGVYLFDELPIASGDCDVNYIFESGSKGQHQIQFALNANPSASLINFVGQTISANVSSSSEIVLYHGKPVKVGKLENTMGSVTLKQQYNSNAGLICWFMVYGNHYD